MSQRRKQRSIFTKIDELACGLRQAKVQQLQRQDTPPDPRPHAAALHESQSNGPSIVTPVPLLGSNSPPGDAVTGAGATDSGASAMHLRMTAAANLQAYFECAMALALAQQQQQLAAAQATTSIPSPIKPTPISTSSSSTSTLFPSPLFNPFAAPQQLLAAAAAAVAAAGNRPAAAPPLQVPAVSGAPADGHMQMLAAFAGAGRRPIPSSTTLFHSPPTSTAYAHQLTKTTRQQQLSGNSAAGTAPRFQCTDCSRSYSTFSGLSKHRQFHCGAHNKRAFSCKFCPKQYGSLGALKMHIRTHTLPCKCHVCGKAFSRPWLLQGHLRTHTGEKPFGCPSCGRAFADRSNLRAHLQTHSEVKKYRCSKCGKTFSRMSLLSKHEGAEGGCSGTAAGGD